METPSATAAPAQPAPVPTISAGFDAASKGDFAAFDAAEQSARRGAPLPRVDAPAAVPAAPAEATPPAERTLSKRQQDANDRTRAAVDAATADLRAEIARLKAGQPAPAAAAAPPPPAAAAPVAKTPEWKRYMAMPDAPKLAEFDSVEEHAIAAALFISETRDSERQADARTRQSDETRSKDLAQRGQQFGDRLRAAVDADPEIISKIAPAIMAARPLSGLSADELKTATFANAVAEAGLHSDNPAALFLHLSSNPDEAQQIGSLPPAHWERALARLDGRLTAGSRAPAAPVADPDQSPAAPRTAAPSIVSAAPPPVQTVTRAGSTGDPKKAALSRGDFATFDKLEMAGEIAKRRPA